MNDDIRHSEEEIAQDVPTPTTEATSESCANCKEYVDGWKRAQADYANLKKDTEREKLEMIKYANQRLLQELLPAVDQFDTALRFTPDVSGLAEEDAKKMKNWIAGVQAVRSLWSNAFQSIGLEKVPVVGAFDPQIHEAVGSEAQTDIPSGQIIRVAQDGWKMHGKLLRPAQVIISE